MKNLYILFLTIFTLIQANAQNNVTFEVNTARIVVGDNGMYLGGGYFGDAVAYPMSDTDGDGTWTVTVYMPGDASGNYIFLNSPNDGGD